jgi:hypothetical protein
MPGSGGGPATGRSATAAGQAEAESGPIIVSAMAHLLDGWTAGVVAQ